MRFPCGIGLQGRDDADFFIAGRPCIRFQAFAVAGQRCSVYLFRLGQNLIGEMPDTGRKWFVFLRRNEVDRNTFARYFADDGMIEGELEDVAVAPAIALKPFQGITSFEVDQTVFWGEPIHADLAGDSAVFRTDDALGTAVRQEFGGSIVQPHGLLEFGDEAEFARSDDFLRLGSQPFGVCLGGLSKRLIGLGVDGTVADDVLLVEGGTTLQGKAVGGSSQSQRGTLGLRDFTADLAVIEFGGLAEVSQQVAREIAPVPAFGMVLHRGDLDDRDVHGCRLLFVFQGR